LISKNPDILHWRPSGFLALRSPGNKER